MELQIQISNKTSAWELISDVFKNLPNRNYRENWHMITYGMEQNLPAVKECAEKIGVRLIEVEAE